jgi:hypothetical protein
MIKWKYLLKKTVYFIPCGRTGNNIFQYLASEIIKYMFNFDDVKKINSIPENTEIINDDSFNFISQYFINNKKKFYCDKDIVLNGYFQNSTILVYMRDHLLKLFNTSNDTYINDKYKISDFSTTETKHQIKFDDDTIVLHLRLDDFIRDNNPPEIFDKVELSKYIDTIKFKKLYIVCDKINHEWEKRYLHYFVNKYKATVLSGSLMDDFNLLKISNRLITSNSTFSWIAAYLGNAKEVHIPYSPYHKNQSLKECHKNSTVKYGIPFSKNLLNK